METFIERIPPHNLEAEQAVLASLLCGEDVAPVVGPLLSPSAFYREAHGAIYAAAMRLVGRGQPVDLITIREALGPEGVENVGGFGYLVDLAGSVPTTAYAEHYARIVAETAQRRAVIAAATDAARRAFEPGVDADTIGGELAATLNRILLTGPASDDGWRDGWYTEALARRAEASKARHLDTGIYDLDQALTFTPGELVILAARPSMGKTALSTAIAWGAARYTGVDLYSLEMDRDRVADRLAVMLDEGIDGRALERGRIDPETWERLREVQGHIMASGLRLLKPARLRVEDVRLDLVRAKAKGRKVGMVVIDYLGLMTFGRAERHDQAVGLAALELKRIAGEFGVVMVVLSQLSRKCEGRPNKRPLLSDLKDSGDVEAHADKILMLYRDDYYAQQEGRKADNPGIVEVNVGKYRNGAVGTINLHFDKRRQTFSSPEFQADDLGAEWAS